MTYFIIILFGVTMLFASAAGRLEGYIRILAFQGFLLFVMILLETGKIGWPVFIFLSVETLVFKTVIIPLILMRTLRKSGVTHEIEPYISSFFSVLIVSLIFAFGFFAAFWAIGSVGVIGSTGIDGSLGTIGSSQGIRPVYFGVSVSVIISGLFIIMTRKKVITHVIGYMMMENGIFLLSLSIAREMPLIVNLGVLLDIFIGIYLLGMFVNKIQAVFDEDHIDTLTHLKD